MCRIQSEWTAPSKPFSRYLFHTNLLHDLLLLKKGLSLFCLNFSQSGQKGIFLSSLLTQESLASSCFCVESVACPGFFGDDWISFDDEATTWSAEKSCFVVSTSVISLLWSHALDITVSEVSKFPLCSVIPSLFWICTSLAHSSLASSPVSLLLPRAWSCVPFSLAFWGSDLSFVPSGTTNRAHASCVVSLSKWGHSPQACHECAVLE